MDPMPPSRILSRISYLPSRSVPGSTTERRPLPGPARDCILGGLRMSGSEAELAAAHRVLDTLLGRFLAAAGAGALEEARASIVEFDETLRRHTADEEEHLFPPPPERKLLEDDEESPEARRSRELRLEHVQSREVSGMMRRLVEQNGDLEGARRLFGNLARRWDAHTEREERALAR